jgi:hypothetical protein
VAKPARIVMMTTVAQTTSVSIDQNEVFRRTVAEPCVAKLSCSCWPPFRSASSDAIRLVRRSNSRAALRPGIHVLHQQRYRREVGLPNAAKAPDRDALPCKLFCCAPNLVGLRLAKKVAIIFYRTHRLASTRLMQRVEKADV